MSLPYLIEVSVCIAVLYLLYFLLFRSTPYYQANRFYLLIGTIISFIIPLITVPFSLEMDIVKPEGFISITDIGQAPVAGQVVEAPVSEDTQVPIWKIVYLTGFSASLLILVFNLTRLLIKRSSFKKGTVSGHKVLFTQGAIPTSSFFQEIYWDQTQDYCNESREMVLFHENVHVRQYHSLDIVFMEIVKSVLWFNPFIYALKNAVIHLHEYLADRKVAERYPKEGYSNLIIEQLFAQSGINVTNSFAAKNIKNRLRILNRKNNASGGWWRYLAVLPGLFVLTLVFGQFDQKEGNENSKIIPFNVWAFDNLGNREYDFNFRNLLLRRENYGRMNNISHKIKYIQYIQEGNLYFYGQLADSLNVIAKDQRVSGRFYLNGELIASSQPVFTDENGVFEFSVPYDEAYWKVKVSEKGSSLEGIEGHFKRLQSREFHIHTGLGYLKGNNHILYYR